MGAENLGAKSDSKLITSQITGEYQTMDAQLSNYLVRVKDLTKNFKVFEAIFVPQEQNARADLLAKLASTKKPGNNKTVIQEVISAPSTETIDINMVSEESQVWMTPIVKYLTRSFKPMSEEEKALVRRRASKFTMAAGKLHRMGRATTMLRCLEENETSLVILEVHEGVCGSHIGGRAL